MADTSKQAEIEAVAKHFLSLDQDVFDPDDWPEGNEDQLYERIAEIAISALDAHRAATQYIPPYMELHGTVSEAEVVGSEIQQMEFAVYRFSDKENNE